MSIRVAPAPRPGYHSTNTISPIEFVPRAGGAWKYRHPCGTPFSMLWGVGRSSRSNKRNAIEVSAECARQAWAVPAMLTAIADGVALICRAGETSDGQRFSL